jgi:hypothetical protein
MSVYESLNIRVLPKNCNPPNVPQIRPIEKVWAQLKCRVFLNGWTAKTTKHLRIKISKEITNLSQNHFQNLMNGLKTKVRKVADNRVLSSIN